MFPVIFQLGLRPTDLYYQIINSFRARVCSFQELSCGLFQSTRMCKLNPTDTYLASRVWGEASVYFKVLLVILKHPKLRTSSITHSEIPISVNSCWANQRMTKSSPCGFCLLLILQLTLFLMSNSIFYTYFLFWVQDAPSEVLLVS